MILSAYLQNLPRLRGKMQEPESLASQWGGHVNRLLTSHVISSSILPLKSGTVNEPSPLSALQKFEQRIISLSTNHGQFVTNR